jgi:hypothetical protein
MVVKFAVSVAASIASEVLFPELLPQPKKMIEKRAMNQLLIKMF